MIYLIDLFCGAGGVSTGAGRAKGVKVVACVNHDELAIKSHKANHPRCIHYTEDIRTLDLTGLIKLVAKIRAKDARAIIGLWASLECTNFSIAKGGMSRHADSRTLAHHLYRYLEALQPDIVYIENVKEFKDWGPCQIKEVHKVKGKDVAPFCPLEVKKIQKKTRKQPAIVELHPVWVPIPHLKKTDFNDWKAAVEAYGYKYDSDILNAADFGAYTSRKRYFAQFTNTRTVAAWPLQTHAKAGSKTPGKFKRWKAVKKVLQLQEHGQSIFGRSKDLEDPTYERLYKGLVKFVAGGKKKYEARRKQHKKLYANQAEYPAFISTYHGTGANVFSIAGPGPTIPTKDSVAIVYPQTQFVARQFSGGGQLNDINGPIGSLPTKPKADLVTPVQFLMDTQYNNGCKSIEDPAPTQTANRKHFYLLNPQYGNAGGSIEDPAFTLIARMDKMPPYLVEIEPGKYCIKVEPTDTKHMVLIKELMCIYGLVDIKMRMLFIEELLQINGFPPDYILHGTQADKKKFIGNAVEVNQAFVILSASAKANNERELSKAA